VQTFGCETGEVSDLRCTLITYERSRRTRFPRCLWKWVVFRMRGKAEVIVTGHGRCSSLAPLSHYLQTHSTVQKSWESWSIQILLPQDVSWFMAHLNPLPPDVQRRWGTSGLLVFKMFHDLWAHLYLLLSKVPKVEVHSDAFPSEYH
jgi:hypothetical protein